ncbi:MAG: hypothetical protein ACJKTH_03480 [Patescibacteria group bacterium UBA2163]
MDTWVTRYKSIGETPLEVLERYRAEANLDDEVPLAYAGRLDPMAEGKLLILVGDECKKQERYFNLDKAYEFRVLFGFKSDSGDVLGLAEPSPHIPDFTPVELKNTLSTLIGDQEFPYPRFSAKTVDGKPLHEWTLEERLHEITIPTKRSTIYHLALKELVMLPADTVQETIFKKINSFPEVLDPRKALGQDFRRTETRARWSELFTGSTITHYPVATVYCEASSGTYMRTLAEEIAKRLETNGLAFSITRTKIGKRLRRLPLWYQSF